MIRGIGPIYAAKLVGVFGAEVFEVIEQAPERLLEVPGIGKVRASRIAQAWADQKVLREIMVFLHSHGVGTAGRADLHDVWQRRRAGDGGEPLSPGPRHPRHRLSHR